MHPGRAGDMRQHCVESSAQSIGPDQIHVQRIPRDLRRQRDDAAADPEHEAEGDEHRAVAEHARHVRAQHGEACTLANSNKVMFASCTYQIVSPNALCENT